MQSTIKQSEVQQEYPCLKEIKNNTFHSVVLFIAKDEGMCVYTNNTKEYEVGHFTRIWAEDKFSVFNGEVTIKNK
jgi:hypothetical protein